MSAAGGSPAVGKVYFVGAGPGDPGLIAAKGLACLQRGDVVVCDHLADQRLLDEIKPDAELIAARDVCDDDTGEQSAVGALLVRLAGQRKTVVRLLNDDPFTTRLGVGEAGLVAAAGVPFEVVPAVSVAVAAPCYAGIPLGIAMPALLVSELTADRPTAGAIWSALPETGGFALDGVRDVPALVAALIERGRAPETPIAVIRGATLPHQQTIVGTLSTIETRLGDGQGEVPVVVVVGAAVDQRDRLRWFDNRPLFGKRVLVTRPREQAAALAALLQDLGASPVVLPSVSIRPLGDYTALDGAIERLSSYDWAIFTSVNGVSFFFARLIGARRDLRELKGVKLCAIGPATAKALSDRGLQVDYVPEEYIAEGVVAGLKERSVVGARILLPRALEAREVIVKDLAAAGAKIDEVPVYQTVRTEDGEARARQLFANGEIDVVTFTSSSTVRNLVALIGDVAALEATTNACIGPITADTARELGVRVDVVAAEHTMPGMVQAIVEFEKERSG